MANRDQWDRLENLSKDVIASCTELEKDYQDYQDDAQVVCLTNLVGLLSRITQMQTQALRHFDGH